MSSRWCVWRHGQTTYNVERRFQGQSDVPLNEVGLRQAAEAARYLAALRPVGDLLLRPEPGLGHGRRAGAADRADRAAGQGPAGARRRVVGGPDRDRDQGAVPARAGDLDAAGRGARPGRRGSGDCRAGADRGRHCRAASTAVVVSHGAALGMAVARLLQIPWEPRVLGPFGNCRWSVLSRRGARWRLLEHNVGILPDLVGDGDAGGV